MQRRQFLKLGSAGLLSAVAGSRFQGAALARDGSRVVIKPAPTDEILVNPGMGFETFHAFNGDDRIQRARNYPKCSIAYFRFYWDKLEPEEGKYNFAEIDSLLEKVRAAGQELALRFMPTASANLQRGTPRWYMRKAKGFDYVKGGRPGWAPDHNDPCFLAKQEDLVAAFGERYNGHPRITRMEIGSAGFWGEWHLSNTEPDLPFLTEKNALRIIDAYLKHWHKTPLAMLIGYVPGLRHAVSRGTGWRADSLGDYGHWSNTWCHMFNAYPQKLKEAMADRAWEKGPVAFEPPGSMQDLEQYVPSRGGGYDKMWDQALAWHGSAFNPKSGSIPDVQVPGMRRFLRRCGYRLAINRTVIPATLSRQQRSFPLSLLVENSGVAPVYRDYALAIRLSRSGETHVLKSKCDPRTWLPGEHPVEERLPLSDVLQPGRYQVAVGILPPHDALPAIRLANQGSDQDGWLPLAAVLVRP